VRPQGDDGSWQQTFPINEAIKSANVIGWLPGTTDEWILVGAHLDHLGIDEAGRMFPGADDNASGIAAMLGVATASVRDQSRQAGILFVAFGAEELGLIGSQWLAEHLPMPAAKCLGVINLDMVGRSPFLGSEDFGPAVGALGTPPNNALLASARTACESAGIKLVATEDFPLLEKTIRAQASNRSDDAPFAAAGMTTLFLSTSIHDDYHQPTDTADKVDAATLLRITNCVRGIVIDTTGSN